MSSVQIVIHLIIISIITIKSMSAVKVSVGLLLFPFESIQMRNIQSPLPFLKDTYTMVITADFGFLFKHLQN